MQLASKVEIVFLAEEGCFTNFFQNLNFMNFSSPNCYHGTKLPGFIYLHKINHKWSSKACHDRLGNLNQK